MTGNILFDPLLPTWLLTAFAFCAVASVGLALWRGLKGWALRALTFALLLAALSGPVWHQEDRAPLSDIVLLLQDATASQRLGDRARRTENAASQLEQRLQARRNTEVRRILVPDATDDGGTALMQALTGALSKEPIGRIAGIIALSDGLAHDVDLAPQLPAPLHLLHSGLASDWDRRLIVKNAPAFAILGETITLTLRIEDTGAAPRQAEAPLDISIDGGPSQRFNIPLGIDMEVPVTLPHGGRNVLQFSVPAAGSELTDRNNTAIVQINGVRDRLRVLLVSGEPHPGGRTWRNLLKSDSSVDLVHFTILRPPTKQDGVPVDELSLIAFPTRELFLDKIDDFDLIIFDRYKRRGILPSIYLDNVVDYVANGGAVLVAAGPDFASADSLYRSPLSEILPAGPTALVIDQSFVPEISEVGARHPVTAGLPGIGQWGQWLRLVDVVPDTGHTVMTGAGERPLLVLSRYQEGRVALLASDQAWLWARGYDGGGPQLELLRRLAHWMMGEPDLEEEALWAEANGQKMRIIRRSLTPDVGQVTIEAPDGSKAELPLIETKPGQFEAQYDGPEMGLYRLTNGEQSAVIGLGPASPKEFAQVIASGDVLDPIIRPLRGGVMAISDGLPSLRTVRSGRPAAGNGWIGLTPRNAFETLNVSQTPLLPAWLVLLALLGLAIGAWLREGRH
ncbi:membrane protein [Cognatishimia sp. WU-CL00825]|uniref:glutamine amidotransferase n=1 Tax=Cognatishimia sp. WU-CL00825 TaxID=3127658 RepID=UPI003102694C